MVFANSVKNGGFVRANRCRPCKICGKSKWCEQLPDGRWLCMHVESAHPARGGGWIHGDTEPDWRDAVYPPQPAPTPAPAREPALLSGETKDAAYRALLAA